MKDWQGNRAKYDVKVDRRMQVQGKMVRDRQTERMTDKERTEVQYRYRRKRDIIEVIGH